MKIGLLGFTKPSAAFGTLRRHASANMIREDQWASVARTADSLRSRPPSLLCGPNEQPPNRSSANSLLKKAKRALCEYRNPREARLTSSASPTFSMGR